MRRALHPPQALQKGRSSGAACDSRTAPRVARCVVLTPHTAFRCTLVPSLRGRVLVRWRTRLEESAELSTLLAPPGLDNGRLDAAAPPRPCGGKTGDAARVWADHGGCSRPGDYDGGATSALAVPCLARLCSPSSPDRPTPASGPQEQPQRSELTGNRRLRLVRLLSKWCGPRARCSPASAPASLPHSALRSGAAGQVLHRCCQRPGLPGGHQDGPGHYCLLPQPAQGREADQPAGGGAQAQNHRH